MQKTIFILVAVLLLTGAAISSFFKRKKRAIDPASRITVTGNTQNIAGYAAVVADNKVIFYVDGMNVWEDNWVNQKVKVTGDLELVGDESFGKNETHRQIRIIKSAVVLLQSDN